jgi:hypothetical protein
MGQYRTIAEMKIPDAPHSTRHSFPATGLFPRSFLSRIPTSLRYAPSVAPLHEVEWNGRAERCGKEWVRGHGGR